MTKSLLLVKSYTKQAQPLWPPERSIQPKEAIVRATARTNSINSKRLVYRTRRPVDSLVLDLRRRQRRT